MRSKLILSKDVRLNVFFLLAGILLLAEKSTAQNFRLMRYDEDYSFLRMDTVRNFYKNFKFIPLSANKQAYLSIGGESRIEFDAFNNEDWGQHNAGNDNFLLQ